MEWQKLTLEAVNQLKKCGGLFLVGSKENGWELISYQKYWNEFATDDELREYSIEELLANFTHYCFIELPEENEEEDGMAETNS